MTVLTSALSVCAGICGLIGGAYWLRASMVPTKPAILDRLPVAGLEDAALSENPWVWPFLQAVAKSAELNAKAARWTAAAAGRRNQVFDAHTSVAVLQRNAKAVYGRAIHFDTRHFADALSVSPEMTH
jgi:hypothetical protein